MAAGPRQQISRRQLLRAAGAGGLLVLVPHGARALDRRSPPRSTSNVVVRWNQALLQGVRDSRLGPPMVSRALAVAHTCMYDAWAAYDRRAVGTRLGGDLRRPERERRLANKAEAITFAAYRAAADLFPGDRANVFDPLMAELGYEPDDLSTDPAEPAGIGNLVADEVFTFRHRDGANQLGDEPGGQPGVPYSDYTGFVPRNDPMDIREPFDPDAVHDADAWQPLRYVDGSGVVVTPPFVGAQWQRVTPFAMDGPDELRSTVGPARYGSPEYEAQAQALIDISAGLSDEQKVIAEYWADGPRSELPPGHWNLFAQLVSHRDRTGDSELDLDRAVKLFFVLTNAIFDAGICAWDDKCFFASVRPITAIRYQFRGRRVDAWAGPGLARRRSPVRSGSPTNRGPSRRRHSPSTRPAIATSARPAQRSSGCSRDEIRLGQGANLFRRNGAELVDTGSGLDELAAPDPLCEGRE